MIHRRLFTLSRKEEVTFLKKSNQKTFAPGGFSPAGASARRSKSFLLLFFKKEALTFFPIS
jgi:hypothetical protein